MKTLVISKNKLESLEKYVLEKNINNTECKLYIWDGKVEKKMLKIFYINEGVYFGNKLLTINSLYDAKKKINIPELVMPEKLVIVKNNVVGYSMPFIEGRNLLNILSDYKVPISQKIEFLRQVGKIIEKVQNKSPYDQPFYLSDIHEANFIYDSKRNKVCAVDLDGCKIANNDPSPIKYLSTNPNMNNLTYKYIRNENGIYKPNANSELLCYILMILNTISHHQINRLNTYEFYSYIHYLRDLGFSYELLDCFNNIYTSANNTSPVELIEEIEYNQNTPKALYKVFECKFQKQK